MFKPDELSPGKQVESTEIHSIQRACPLDNGSPSLSEKRHKAVVGGLQKTRTPGPQITSIEQQTSTKAGDVWRFSGLWPAWLEDQQAGSGMGQVPRTIRITAFVQNGSSVSSLASRIKERYPRNNIASEPYSSISMKEANESNRCI